MPFKDRKAVFDRPPGENAKKMKAMNLSTEMIHQITGLSVQEIDKL